MLAMSIIYKVRSILALSLPFVLLGCEKDARTKRTIQNAEAHVLVNGFHAADEFIEMLKLERSWPPAAQVLPLGLPVEPGTVRIAIDGDIGESDLDGIRLAVRNAFMNSGSKCAYVRVTHKLENEIAERKIFQRVEYEFSEKK